MNRLEWRGDEAIEHVRRLAAAGLTRAAITVARRARELLSVAGTAVATGVASHVSAAKAHHSAIVAENRAFVRLHNQKHALAIKMGDMKRLRVTKAGHITDRAKPGSKKTYYFNEGGKMVRRKRKRPNRG